MKSLDCRLAKFESAAGLSGNWLTQVSDAELDEMLVRAYAEGEALGMDQTEFMFFDEATTEPNLSVHREFWPMSSDIEALEVNEPRS